MSQNKETTENVRLPFFGIPKLLPYIRSQRRDLIWMTVLNVFAAIIDTLLPLFQQYAINHYIGESTLDTLGIFIPLYIFALVVQVVTNAYSAYISGRVEMHVDRDLRRGAFNHLQTLSFSYFNQNSVGYIHSRVMSDTSRIGELVAWSFLDGTWNLTLIVATSCAMLALNARLALLVLIIIPLIAVISYYFQNKLVEYNRKTREANSQISGAFNEGITGAKTTKTLVTEDLMNQDFKKVSKTMTRVSVLTSHFRQMFTAIISFASYTAVALVLWRGGYLALDGIIKIGTLSVFATYAMNLMEPVQWAVGAFADLIAVQVNVERFTNLMETESDVADSPEVVEKYGDTFHPKKENWEPLYGDIEFKDVSFMYPDGDEYVLEHFNLKVPQGTNVAIVGETGAGKSTLVNLVCRFFEPTSGQVLIDGRDARERSQLWLHSNLGYVLQTPHLFSGTVRENLLYGRPDATEEEMMAAVHAVHADGVIARMEKGYDSDVGEGGDLLSTGEKQLLSFARAVLANPRIFVLDEATSSIDTETEQLIQEATESLLKGRTSFVIAHRLSTIRQADVILMVHDGKIIEKGTHAELMAAKGAYYQLYTQQFIDESMKAF